MSSHVPYTPPEHTATVFNCPMCHVYARQYWGPAYFMLGQVRRDLEDTRACLCEYCARVSIWQNGRMVSPLASFAPPANPDLPAEVQEDYTEASTISSLSPRGAAALLRLAIQKLCKHLGEPGKDINSDIASLVKKGLPVQIQQALDIVRVVGNESVHPGQLDLKDDTETVNSLFKLINLIAETMITQPKHVAAMYASVVPESKRKAIEVRDGK